MGSAVGRIRSLLTFALVWLLGAIFVREATGWLFTSQGFRNLMALLAAALCGPLVAGAIGAWVSQQQTGSGWAGFWGPVMGGYLLSGLVIAWVLVRQARLPKRPPALEVFLAQWERMGLGEVPVVELQVSPGIVRLRFPDAVRLEGEAKRLIDELEQALAPDYALILWVGRKPR